MKSQARTGVAVKRRPVLILGCIPRIVLPVARSLHQQGISVDLVSFSSAASIPSRAISEFRRLPRPDHARGEFVDRLRDFVLERGHDMLVVTDDWTLSAVVEHYEFLSELLHVSCPPPNITRRVQRKADTLRVAEQCGIAIPKTEVVWNSSELHGRVSLPFPWVVKPAWRETRTEEFKSCVFASGDEVVREFPSRRDFSPPMLVQEYCAGVGVGIEVLMHEGDSIALFQHGRLKELPFTGGVSVTAVAESPDQTLVQCSLALLRALQWEGPAMVEYKVGDDGKAVLMEVNGRYWGTIGLAISAGVDFPFYHWQLMHGEIPVVPPSYRVGKKWRSTVDYIWRLHNLIDFAQAGSPTARRALWDDLRTLGSDFAWSVRDATFRASDPAPWVLEITRAMRHIVSEGTRRALEWLKHRIRFPASKQRWEQQGIRGTSRWN
jgi:predicted ATP-grasp superfamily ATP-dependent carboligase